MDENRVWRRLHALVFGYFERRIDDRHRVEDLAQEACLRAWRRRRRDSEDVLALRILAIGRNLLIDHLRRRARRHEVTAEGLDRFDASYVQEGRREARVRIGDRELGRSAALALLEACLADLPPRYGAALAARARGLPLRAIGRRLGLGENAVRMRLYRGRRVLARAMPARMEEWFDADTRFFEVDPVVPGARGTRRGGRGDRADRDAAEPGCAGQDGEGRATAERSARARGTACDGRGRQARAPAQGSQPRSAPEEPR